MSRLESGDEQNGSFGAVTRPSQDVKSGVVSSAAKAEAGETKEPRRSPGKQTYAREPLAKRIRERDRR